MSINISVKFLVKILAFIVFNAILSQCGLYKKVDSNTPIQGEERARKNINEGKGVSLKNLGRGSTNYEFSSSNPMWRASLEILDFIPLSTVDYSGGVIITDWYNDSKNKNESIKITIRFLSNEIAAANIKIIVHQKKCLDINNCTISELNSNLKNELTKTILKEASLLEANSKENK